MTADPTVFVVDDDDAVRESLCEMIRAMPLPVQCFASAKAFLDACDPAQPGCLVLDVRMPGMPGLELQERLNAKGTGWPVIIITAHGDVPMALQSMRLGAINFLEKPYRPVQLRESIWQALKIDTQRRQEQARHKDMESRLSRLTPSEYGVMEQIVAGQTNKQIAAELAISLRTVQFRRSRIMEKLNVDSRAALMELVSSAKQLL